METLTATNARNNFADLLKEAESEVVQITQHNKPAAAVMSWDYYESMLETLEILSDPETMQQIIKGERDVEAGRVTDWDVVKSRLIPKQ
ncbi:MAG: type II toxin-antitoxin system Phd/YefM family antitoxin [Candidatus Hatepunaea meridiana]|nr:type II toxin-antitoxin system Phd/YefM family antitoxin [Candidatus Hatepunaea meridiana]